MKRLFAIVTMLVALVSACGKKGDPRAPELAAPRTITNLTARSEPKGVALTWSRPTEYVDGSALKDLASFVIFRKEVSRDLSRLSGAVSPAHDRQRRGPGKIRAAKSSIASTMRKCRPKAIYRYRVSSQLFDGSLSAPSNEVEIARGDK